MPIGSWLTSSPTNPPSSPCLPESIYEGWLVKSPPSNRVIKARWRRRFFVLRPSSIGGQYFLEYYSGQDTKKLKGRIDLNDCTRVERGEPVGKYKYLLDLTTKKRTYSLAAESEELACTWVRMICQCCGLVAPSSLEDDAGRGPPGTATTTLTAADNNNKDSGEEESPYIPISECISGGGTMPVRPQDPKPIPSASPTGHVPMVFRYDEESIRAVGPPIDRKLKPRMGPPMVDRSVKPDKQGGERFPLASPPPGNPSRIRRQENISNVGFASSQTGRKPSAGSEEDEYYSYPYPDDHSRLQYVTLDLDSRQGDYYDGGGGGGDYGGSCYMYQVHVPPTPSLSSATTPGTGASASSTGTVYKTVDFVKTQALNQTRMQWESEKHRLSPEDADGVHDGP